MRWIVSLFVVAAAVCDAAPLPKLAKAELLVVSVDEKSGKSQIVRLNEDGSNVKALTDAESNASFPAWSPDGKRIAFCSDRDGGRMQVFAMDADGSNVEQITSEPSDARAPNWSPDGKKIVYARSSGSSIGVVVDADGKNPKELGEDVWDPAFSPDGTKIAFVSTRNGGFRLFVMNADGDKVTEVVDKPNNIGFAYPAWSPSGERIAFGHLVDGHIELHSVAATGKDLKQITDFGGFSVYPAWSPDGKKIAFVQYKSGEKASLVIATDDGKNPKTIMKDFAPAEGGRPSWRPKAK